jgi:5-methylcytosine-specific restriction endonuclease McrA
MDLASYLARIENGEKWCTGCRDWRPVDQFGRDASRSDGLASACQRCRRVAERVSTKGRPSAFRGRTHSDDAKSRMSAARRGKPNGRLGAKHTLETRKKISAVTRERTPRGRACHSFKDGKMAERRGERLSLEYKRWRYDVYVRDGFACRHCGDARGGNLHAHHIKPFADHPELRYDVGNGITLCKPCHKKVHARG